MSQRFHYHLEAPVVVITAGRGVEKFDDTAKLFARLGEIVIGVPFRMSPGGEKVEEVLREKLLSIRWGAAGAVTEDGLMSLETMLALEGWQTFNRAGMRLGAPHNRPFTRWEWERLGEYLGWEWRPL